MNKKEKVVFEAISKAYSDASVQNDPELSRLLLTSAQSLEKGESHKSISKYLLTHSFKAPNAINDLYNDIKKEAESHRGAASIGIWLNNH
ncbi:bacteriocin immunity protein [Alkalibacterium sp. 20]|uniref:bacteriocin immunity protein n=1 Tax=Alkalibacterium sp. 20 TaxID=1798803 RepID=UPI00090001DE|nr:bacteriocin immunity protein [Alkalibacterium sp. 20]OJF97072.1 hypothetical protein AX762_00490 [Alkalibacterium sp. 20]